MINIIIKDMYCKRIPRLSIVSTHDWLPNVTIKI